MGHRGILLNAGTAIFFLTLMSIDGLAVESIHLLRINMNGLRFLSTLPVIDISFSPRYFPPLSSSYLSQVSPRTPQVDLHTPEIGTPPPVTRPALSVAPRPLLDDI